jgi:hypothetical protein
LIVEAGLGTGLNGYGNLSVHTLPSTKSAQAIWGQSRQESIADNRLLMPAYRAAEKDGMDICGLVMLASRSIGVPFVGLTAGTLVVAELLRRIHSGPGIDVMSVMMSSPIDSEVVICTKSLAYLGSVSRIQEILVVHEAHSRTITTQFN